jgi:hypothetical protein
VTEDTRVTWREVIRWHDQQLEGWICRSCELSEVTPYDIETFLAARFVPRLLAEALNQSDLNGAVRIVLDLRIPGLSTARADVQDAVVRSGIIVRVRERWPWTCPRCGSDRTAVYRWDPVDSVPPRFVPAANNLPLGR